MNLIEVSCERENLELENFLENNDARGDIRIPLKFRCNIIWKDYNFSHFTNYLSITLTFINLKSDKLII